jgi:cysteinyl-tRNA synthetase
MSMKYLGETFDITPAGSTTSSRTTRTRSRRASPRPGGPSPASGCTPSTCRRRRQDVEVARQPVHARRPRGAGVDLRALRYLFVSVHYRQKLNFTFQSLEAAANALRRIDEMRFRVEHAGESGPPAAKLAAARERAERDFTAALADDLNVAAAHAAVFGLVRAVNVAVEENRLGEGDRRAALDTFAAFDRVLGVLDPAAWRHDEAPPAGPSDDEVEALITARREARTRRDFAEADRLRDELAAAGIVIEDTPSGTRWKRG